MRRGIVIGKFCPLHLGHVHLIESALAGADEVVVIVCDSPDYDVSLEQRIDWMSEAFPEVEIVSIDGHALALDDNDSEGWADATIERLGGPPDVVFTSEEYGPRYASFLGAEHVMVDLERSRVPASGTQVRADPLGSIDLVPEHVRPWFVKRVCVIGAESTGKTTLARDLAEALDTTFMPEFGRHYTEAMPDPARYQWTAADFQAIAEAQIRFEDDAARWAGPVLICDTNPLVTSVFCEVFLGAPDPELQAMALARSYDLYLLCDPETPFEQDHTGLRHSGPKRRWMHDRYVELISAGAQPCVEVAGNPRSRLARALEAVDDLRAPRPRH